MISLKEFKSYHFQLYHVIILILIVILSQVMLAYINVRSVDNVVNKSIELYRWDTAERLADLATTSLELLLQPTFNSPNATSEFRTSTSEALDFTLSQQILQKNVEDICLLFKTSDNKIIDIDQGSDLFDYLTKGLLPKSTSTKKREKAKEWFNKSQNTLFKMESIATLKEGTHTFHILVPFSKHGEVLGAVYLKVSPDFKNITKAVASSYDQSGALISAVILLSLLAMFSITTFLVKDRDMAQYQLFKHKEKELKERIESQKESFFTKKIYHAHHKAEKIVGFIKEDLRNLTHENLETVRIRLSKYSGFMGRVIYDMKTYNPPINVIRNSTFNTNINSVIEFIVNNIFKRVYKEGNQCTFNLMLMENLPSININEYVVWQILEPLIQNSIDHNQKKNIVIEIKTTFDEQLNKINIYISDNGSGIAPYLLETNENGIKKIFLENSTTKNSLGHAGYGCYIAYEICKLCGWTLDAYNTNQGAVFFITAV
ncbi:sensor histidine kinase [Melioribacteraceae bacterium 4301-Me]|uniref:sensor histidine kinase n=1 Tax=Pyranulibacter aquaticus TaxID=3163344 RepID=UPI00359573A0